MKHLLALAILLAAAALFLVAEPAQAASPSQGWQPTIYSAQPYWSAGQDQPACGYQSQARVTFYSRAQTDPQSPGWFYQYRFYISQNGGGYFLSYTDWNYRDSVYTMYGGFYPGNTYSIRMTAMDYSWSESPYSNTVSFTVPKCFASSYPAQSVSVTRYYPAGCGVRNQLKVQWTSTSSGTNPSTGLSFHVQESVDGRPWSSVSSVDYRTRSYITGYKDAPHTYSYRVQTRDAYGGASGFATGTIGTAYCSASQFRPQASAVVNDPCGGPFTATLSYGSPPQPPDDYAVRGWRDYRIERQENGKLNWHTVYTDYWNRFQAKWTDTGLIPGTMYQYRVWYEGVEGSSSTLSNTVTPMDCAVPEITKAHFVAVCPPRVELAWKLVPKAGQTAAYTPPFDIFQAGGARGYIQRNAATAQGISHPGPQGWGQGPFTWTDWSIQEGDRLQYQIRANYGAKGSTYSPWFTVDAPVKACNDPRITAIQASDAVNRNGASGAASIKVSFEWDPIDPGTPYWTVDGWSRIPPGCGGSQNGVQLWRLEKHPNAGARDSVAAYKNRANPSAFGEYRLVASFPISTSQRAWTYTDNAVWGNIAYTYQVRAWTATQDINCWQPWQRYWSNTATTYVRAEPWPAAHLRVETLPHIQFDTRQDPPPGDYPAGLDADSSNPRYGYALVEITPGDTGAGGPVDKLSVDFTVQGSLTTRCEFTAGAWQAKLAANAQIKWQLRSNVRALIYPTDFRDAACSGSAARPLTVGTGGHSVAVRLHNARGWSDATTSPIFVAWTIAPGSTRNDPVNTGGTDFQNPVQAKHYRTDRVQHNVVTVGNAPLPSPAPATYQASQSPGVPYPRWTDTLANPQESIGPYPTAGEPCGMGVGIKEYQVQVADAFTVGADVPRVGESKPITSPMSLHLAALNYRFSTLNNPYGAQRGPVRFTDITQDPNYYLFGDGKMAYGTPRIAWRSGDYNTFSDWSRVFSTWNPPQLAGPFAAIPPLGFNGMGQYCFISNLAALGHRITNTFPPVGEDPAYYNAFDQLGQDQARQLLAHVPVTGTASFLHYTSNYTTSTSGEYQSDANWVSLHRNAMACRCIRMAQENTQVNHWLTQTFQSDYDKFLELQGRGSIAPASGFQAFEGQGDDPGEQAPVDVLEPSIDDFVHDATKAEQVLRNVVDAPATSRLDNGGSGRPNTPGGTYAPGEDYPNQELSANGQLFGLWGIILPSYAVRDGQGTLYAPGDFQPVLYLGGTDYPMRDYHAARNWTYRFSFDWSYVLGNNGVPAPIPGQSHYDSWDGHAPNFTYTPDMHQRGRGLVRFAVDATVRLVNGTGDTVFSQTLQRTAGWRVMPEARTASNATGFGLPVLKADRDPLNRSTWKAVWLSYPTAAPAWATWDPATLSYTSLPPVRYFNAQHTNVIEYRDPDPTPTGAITSPETAYNITHPDSPPSSKDQADVTQNTLFGHIAWMLGPKVPWYCSNYSCPVTNEWNLFDISSEPTRWGAAPRPGGGFLSTGSLNAAQSPSGSPPGTVYPVRNGDRLDYWLRMTPTCTWDAAKAATIRDGAGGFCNNPSWQPEFTVQVYYDDGSSDGKGYTNGAFHTEMLDKWAHYQIPLQAGKYVERIALIGKPLVYYGHGPSQVYNLYFAALRITNPGAPTLHLFDYYQRQHPNVESVGWSNGVEWVEFINRNEHVPATGDLAGRIDPLNPFLLVKQIDPLADTNPYGFDFRNPHFVQGIILGQPIGSNATTPGASAAAQSLADFQKALGLPGAGDGDYPYFQGRTFLNPLGAGLGPWVPWETNYHQRYNLMTWQDPNQNESSIRAPTSLVEPTSPGATPQDIGLPNLLHSYSMSDLLVTNNNRHGPDFFLTHGLFTDPSDQLRAYAYYDAYDRQRDVGVVRNLDGTYSHVTVVDRFDVRNATMSAAPLWVFRDPVPSPLRAERAYRLAADNFVGQSETTTLDTLYSRMRTRALQDVTPGKGYSHIEIAALPARLDGCWRVIAGNATDMKQFGSWNTTANLATARFQGDNDTVQVRLYLTFYRPTDDSNTTFGADACHGPYKLTPPVRGSFPIYISHQDLVPGQAPRNVFKVLSVDPAAPYNSSAQVADFTMRVGHTAYFHAVYDADNLVLQSASTQAGHKAPDHRAPDHDPNWLQILRGLLIAAAVAYVLTLGFRLMARHAAGK